MEEEHGDDDGCESNSNAGFLLLYFFKFNFFCKWPHQLHRHCLEDCQCHSVSVRSLQNASVQLLQMTMMVLVQMMTWTHNNFLTHLNHLHSHWNDRSVDLVGYIDNFCTETGHHCTAGKLQTKYYLKLKFTEKDITDLTSTLAVCKKS